MEDFSILLVAERLIGVRATNTKQRRGKSVQGGNGIIMDREFLTKEYPKEQFHTCLSESEAGKHFLFSSLSLSLSREQQEGSLKCSWGS